MISLFSLSEPMPFEQVKMLPEPEYFHDLNLNQYVDILVQYFDDKELRPYFYFESKDYETAKYRQEIVNDLKNPDILEAVRNFIGEISEAVRCNINAENVSMNIQKCKWRLDCMTNYYRAMENLCISFNATPPKSRAFYNLHQELFHLLNSAEIKKVRATAKTIAEEFQNLKFHLTVNNEKATFDLLYDLKDYCFPIRNAFEHGEADPTPQVFKESPFDNIELSDLEIFVLKQLEKQNLTLFRQLETFGGTYKNIISQEILDLIRELRFYMFNIEYMDRLKSFGYPFTQPLIVKDKELYMDDCFDIVLAIKNMKLEKEVIYNDIMKANFEKAIIVTGPNQGGKTTLARAFGQCFYFGMMGLNVPGSVCKLPYISNIFTHFANEEGSEGIEGRLYNELIRLKQMFEKIDNRSIVILNELFTSAPAMDALSMSRDLMKRLLQNNAICFYVTHTYEIASDLDDYVSLVATVVEDGSYRRTYRIVRKRADGNAFANSIVTKYKLDYSHINYRLSKGQKKN